MPFSCGGNVVPVVVNFHLAGIAKYLGERPLFVGGALLLAVAASIASFAVTHFYLDAYQISASDTERERTERDADRRTTAAQRESDAARQEAQNYKQQITILADQIADLRTQLSQEKRDDEANRATISDLQQKLKKYESVDKSKADREALAKRLAAKTNPILVELWKAPDQSCIGVMDQQRYQISYDGCLIFNKKYFIRAHHSSSKQEGTTVSTCIVNVTNTGTGDTSDFSFLEGLSQTLSVGSYKVDLIYRNSPISPHFGFGSPIECMFDALN